MVKCPVCESPLCDELDARMNEIIDAHFLAQHPAQFVDVREMPRVPA